MTHRLPMRYRTPPSPLSRRLVTRRVLASLLAVSTTGRGYPCAACDLAPPILAQPPGHSLSPQRVPNSFWNTWKRRYLRPDGRVTDTGNGGISHSEGQGYGLVLSTHFKDRGSTERIWRWTQLHLQVRDDALLAWRFDPAHGITDPNNAADGDLLTAWGLLRAAALWPRGGFGKAAVPLIASLKRLVVASGHGTLLLPAAQGFVDHGSLVVNLSYWVFPALRALAGADPEGPWRVVSENGLAVLDYARFGRFALPPDWLRMTDPVAPAEHDAHTRFGFDAVRIPLYLIWDGLDTRDRLEPFDDFWSNTDTGRGPSAWTDLRDDSLSPYAAAAALAPLRMWVRARLEGQCQPVLSSQLEDGDYYAATLALLVRVAIAERCER